MTDEPTPPTPPPPMPPQPASPAAEGSAAPGSLPPNSRAARSLTERAKAEEPPTDEPTPEPEIESGPRMWPRVVGVLLLLVVAGGVWVWQNPGFVENSVHAVFPGLAGSGSGSASGSSGQGSPRPASGGPASSGQDVAGPAGEESEIKALDARVTRLEQQQPDTAALSQRLDALEQRMASTGPATDQRSPDLRPLLARLNALEARLAEVRPNGAAPQPATGGSAGPPAATLVPVGPDLAPVLARLDALEKTTGPATRPIPRSSTR